MTRFDAKAFLADDSGATAIEYGLIAGLISVAGIAAFHSMNASLQSLFQGIANTVAAVLGQ